MQQILKTIKHKVYLGSNDTQLIHDWLEVCRIIGQDDYMSVHSDVCELRTVISSRMNSANITTQQMGVLYDEYKRSLLWSAQNNRFHEFMLYIEWNREPSKKFYAPRAHVLKPIVEGFQEVADGKLDLLTVSQPKRTGKTTVGLLFTLMRAGQKPLSSSICCGAGNDLVTSFYSGITDVLQKQDEYLFYDVFPEAKLVHTNADEHTIHLNKKKRFATITTRSIDGALTGSTEATPDGVLYLDDLVKDDVEAKNRNRLDTLWDKVRGDLLGRRLEGCPIIAQGTRYSLHDVIGRLQEVAPIMGWRTKVLEIPALDFQTDESNFAICVGGRWMFTTGYYRKERELLSEEQWESQFQQQPFEAKGLMFPKKDLNYYFELPIDKEPDAIIAVCDTAESGSDSCSMPVAYLFGDDVYIEDVVFDNSPSDITKPLCAKVLIRNKVSTATFESNSAGTYFARDVDLLIQRFGHKCSIRTKRTITNKQTRIEFASDGIKKHFYFKDASRYDRTSQYGMFMRELTSHTRSGKVAHDDAADSLSMLENITRVVGKRTIEAVKRPF